MTSFEYDGDYIKKSSDIQEFFINVFHQVQKKRINKNKNLEICVFIKDNMNFC